MKFFDANVCYGPQKVGMPDVDYSLSALLHRMEEYRIEKALVLHSVAREHDAAFGNARLMNEIKGFGQLIPVWAVMPHHTGEMDAPDVLTEKMVSSGVKAAALFPSAGAHNFSLKRWSAGPLLDALAERRIPVLLGSEQVGGMEGLCEFALAYPKLTVIALNVNYRADRILFLFPQPASEHPRGFMNIKGSVPFDNFLDLLQKLFLPVFYKLRRISRIGIHILVHRLRRVYQKIGIANHTLDIIKHRSKLFSSVFQTKSG